MLPKQQYQFFTAVIPSTKQKIHFRGFTVREEKQLLLAQESEDIDTITEAINAILEGCIKEDISIDSLASFDLEYLLVQIRAKSVGEMVTLKMPCEIDEKHTPTLVPIDLTKIEVQYHPDHQLNIPLYEDVGVTMKYPTLGELAKLDTVSGIEAITLCMENIYTNDEVFVISEQTPEEITEFIEGLTKEQITKIENLFFKTMPTFQYEFTYTCKDCGHTHTRIIRGLESFFV